ncbi:hypothetical protein [Mesorhizobium sp.]|uniref:hypothetical protein n=1 Tax=Mesorhizobium sp. TaxID=1871066 RepID=UPI000FE6E856|nr:hypothetical protein [Mesorhizobium sp.]RWP37314.1 MAG: hypothetical protein EOR03_06130 [Mesorhizobium sp.]
MVPTESRAEKLRILRSAFRAAENRVPTNAVLAGGYWIKLIDGEKLRIGVWPDEHTTHQPELYITVHGQSVHGPAGLIAKKDGKHFLLHDGRTRRFGLARPTSSEVHNIGGKDYFLIGEIDSLIFDNIALFHSSRSALPDGSLTPNNEAARPAEPDVTDDPTNDLGPADPYLRAEALVIPKHHPVAVRAEAWLLRNGFKLLRARFCRPDFFVEKGGKRFVVEIKPDVSLQSIAAAMGQLSIYSEIEECVGRIMILPKEGAEAKWPKRLLSGRPDPKVIFV